jgi:predicted unusual protein kinase regulating ubiquinone biosynthesis (AarF/ABC1/UbiB family)
MNPFVENTIQNSVFTYKNKSYFRRFLTVYAFTLKKSLQLIWHYKILSRFVPKAKLLEKENQLIEQIAFETKNLFIKLGGVYIKLGQFLSNLGHILPENFINHFTDLQDRIPPHSLEEIKIRFYKETGKQLNEVFPEISSKPIAAASTAQVYKAKLEEQTVVVKILYPGIENLVKKDLDTVLFVMKRINRYLVTFDYKMIHSEVKSIITKEMDLLEEAKSLEKMTELFQNYKEDYVFPKVYHEYSTKGILVTEFIEGLKISETKTNTKKTNKKSRPLDLLIKAYVMMVFQFKFFHADPHSGNLIYTPDGRLCFIDFGAVSTVNEITANCLKKIISSAIAKDYYGVVEAMEEMGFFESSVDKIKLEQIAKFAIEKLERLVKNTDIFKNLSLEQINPKEAQIFLKGINSSLSDLMKMARVPSNYVMLERTLGLLMGNIAILDPFRNIFDYSDKYFKSIALGELSFVDKILSEEGNELVNTSLLIPGELHKALLTLNRGRLVVYNKDIEKQTSKFYALGQQFIYTALFISGIHFGNFYSGQFQNLVSYLFFGISAVSGLSLLFSMFKNRNKK